MAEPTPEPHDVAPPVATGDDDKAAADRQPIVIPAFATLTDFDKFLRTTGHYSRREASGIVAEARALFGRVSDEAKRRENNAAILDALTRRTELLGLEP